MIQLFMIRIDNATPGITAEKLAEVINDRLADAQPDDFAVLVREI